MLPRNAPPPSWPSSASLLPPKHAAIQIETANPLHLFSRQFTYSYGTWSAQDNAEAQDAAVADLLSEGLDANMIRFETGTVFKEGQTGMEHMASFNYAYKLIAVRDWLFAQSK